jgi:hypothetical protein
LPEFRALTETSRYCATSFSDNVKTNAQKRIPHDVQDTFLRHFSRAAEMAQSNSRFRQVFSIPV